MIADQLSKAWKEHRKSNPVDAVMRFSDEGLVLGSGTVLARACPSRSQTAVDRDDPRLTALLTAAHLSRPSASALAHLRKAADRWDEGDEALATMHLILSGVDRLSQPEEDAHRLFLADTLLRGGFEPDIIVRVIETKALSPVGLRKYDPDQLRVPAGAGRVSGQWTTGGGGATAVAHATGTRRLSVQPKLRQIPHQASSAARPVRPMATPAANVVNSNTITPVSDHKSSSDTGRRAMIDCMRHVVEDSIGLHDNDNWREKWFFECQMTKKRYDDAEYLVETNPRVSGGIVGFPDGGLIILRKGKDDVYVPAVARGGRSPPFRRGTQLCRRRSL